MGSEMCIRDRIRRGPYEIPVESEATLKRPMTKQATKTSQNSASGFNNSQTFHNAKRSLYGHGSSSQNFNKICVKIDNENEMFENGKEDYDRSKVNKTEAGFQRTKYTFVKTKIDKFKPPTTPVEKGRSVRLEPKKSFSNTLTDHLDSYKSLVEKERSRKEDSVDLKNSMNRMLAAEMITYSMLKKEKRQKPRKFSCKTGSKNTPVFQEDF